MAVWMKQNPRALLQNKYVSHFSFRFFYLLFDVWSGIMFWIIFFTAGYWFFFYKLQENAYLLLPSVDDWDYTYSVFDTIFGIVLAFRFLSIMMAIWEQTSVDILLIDWEHQPQGKMQNGKDNIIVWRSLFVANEFNEMQNDYHYITPETTLIWFVFFIKALGWE